MTRRLDDVLIAIASSIRARSYAPTKSEIAALLGLKSTSVVEYHLVRLVELGFITRTRAHRSIVITAAGLDQIGVERPLDPFSAERSVERLEMGA